MADSIGIVGGGALGTLLTSRFAGAGADVRVVVRSPSRRDVLMREYTGLTAGAGFELLGGCDLVFLCVKSYDTGEVSRALAASGLEGAAVCSLQNGWGHMEILADSLPRSPLLAGASSVGAYLGEDGTLHATGEGEILIAPWHGSEEPQAQAAVMALRRAGFRAGARRAARDVLWRKLVLNSAINPTTALAGCPNGRLLREGPLLRIAQRAAEEAAAVGVRLGVLGRSFDAVGALRSILETTASNRSSMLEDLTRGRRTEIEEINGAVVRLAEESSEPAPVQGALLTLIRTAEERRRPAEPPLQAGDRHKK